MYSRKEKKELVIKFWKLFGNYCKVQPYMRGRRKNWILHRTGVNNLRLKFDPGRDRVVVALELTHNSENERLKIYQKLEEFKLLLEDGFNNGLVWDFAFENNQGKLICRVYTEMRGVDIHREFDWPVMFQFMAQNMYKLERNFLEIRDLFEENS